MKWIFAASEVEAADRRKVGGKGYALARLAGYGFAIPETVCLTVDAYHRFVERTGLRERIMLELNRKDFSEMRWEEIWDCATRIRNMFLRTPMPADVEARLRQEIGVHLKDRPAVVRSSAPEEDDAQASFAGLHESYLNIHGTDAIIAHIRKVWASLWSDAALLYRQEIGLDVEQSAMAVVIQEIIAGERSGVAFSRNPNDAAQAVIESVYGLNQGLVDGLVEPDRWVLDRKRRTIVGHTPALRQNRMVPHVRRGRAGTPARGDWRPRRPSTPMRFLTVFGLAAKAEACFESPQDVEWTFKGDKVFLLQSRPITTLAGGADGDKRGWYLSLHRSFENLKALRKKIEAELIPGMIADADAMEAMDLAALPDRELAREVTRRWDLNQHWVNVYWEDFIPFAHGVRLFGQVYNDVMQPEDAYAFVDLLTQTEMASLERNRVLAELAGRVREDKHLAAQLTAGDHTRIDPDFLVEVDRFIRNFGDLSCSMTGGTRCVEEARPLFNILLEMSAHPGVPESRRKSHTADRLREEFLEPLRRSAKGRDGRSARSGPRELSAAGRRQHLSGSHRGPTPGGGSGGTAANSGIRADRRGEPRFRRPGNRIGQVDPPSETPKPQSAGSGTDVSFDLKPRQLVGQPAGPGLARGKARVIRRHADLTEFKSGEVLICDAVDPNMTFVVPLASAVVERRGGMLIHGAIIAREYGLPCVTGIPDATDLIRTGDAVTVDGYLGIVTVGTGEI